MKELLKFKKGSTKEPKIGDKFIFLDDGKWGSNRIHIAFVKNILTFDEANLITIKRLNTSVDGKVFEEILTVKQSIQQNIDNDFDDTPFFTKHPNQVLVLYIPTYDEDVIYAIRTQDKDYDWFSCDVNNFWQSGGLLSYDDYEKRRGEYNYTTEQIEEKFSEYCEESTEVKEFLINFEKIIKGEEK